MPSIFDRIGGVFDRPGGLFGGSSFSPAAIMTGLSLLAANRNPRTNPGMMPILGQGINMYSGLAEGRWREEERQREEQARQRLGATIFGQYSPEAGGVPWREPDTERVLTGGGLAEQQKMTPLQRAVLGASVQGVDVPGAVATAAFREPREPKWRQVWNSDTGRMEWIPEEALEPGMGSAAPPEQAEYTASNTDWFVVDDQPRLLPIEQGIEGGYPPYEPSDAAGAPKRYMKPLPGGKQQEMQWDAAAAAYVPIGEVVERWQPKGTEGGLTLPQQRTNDEIDSARRSLADRGITPDNLREGLGAAQWSLVSRDPMLSKLWTTASKRKYGDDPGYEETWWKYYPVEREGPAPGEVLGAEEPAAETPGILERARSSIFGPQALPPPHPAAEPPPPPAPPPFAQPRGNLMTLDDGTVVEVIEHFPDGTVKVRDPRTGRTMTLAP